MPLPVPLGAQESGQSSLSILGMSPGLLDARDATLGSQHVRTRAALFTRERLQPQKCPL